jgi:phosphopantothenoylcysteine decarboxylase/phosphopantothenate--cysteine ligase
LINRLRDDGWDVYVVMTEESKAFITPLTLQALSGHQVFDDLFRPVAEWDPVHTTLGERADLVLVSPATANLLGKIAHGLCDDLLSCVITATEAPVIFAPAMNEAMYRKPSVQENIALLTRRGYRFVPPTKGHLVCRREGVGHIADVASILNAVRQVARKPMNARRSAG